MSKGQFDVQVYYINVGRVPALKDRRLRQAISEAIDRETALNDVLGGYGALLMFNVPTTSELYDENAPPFPNYDLENAKRLVEELKAEGVYNGEEIEFLAPRGVYNEDVRQNQVVADMVSQAGINAVAFIADEAFLTNSIYQLLPVATIDKRQIGDEVPGPVSKRLLAAWSELVGVDIVDQALRAG